MTIDDQPLLRHILAAAALALPLAMPAVAQADDATSARATIDIDEELDRLADAEADDTYPMPDIYEASAVSIDALTRDQIVQVQTALRRRGYPIGRADGIVGPPTRMSLNAFLAAKNWPRQHALTPDALRDLGIPIDQVQ